MSVFFWSALRALILAMGRQSCLAPHHRGLNAGEEVLQGSLKIQGACWLVEGKKVPDVSTLQECGPSSRQNRLQDSMGAEDT